MRAQYSAPRKYRDFVRTCIETRMRASLTFATKEIEYAFEQRRSWVDVPSFVRELLLLFLLLLLRTRCILLPPFSFGRVTVVYVY